MRYIVYVLLIVFMLSCTSKKNDRAASVNDSVTNKTIKDSARQENIGHKRQLDIVAMVVRDSVLRDAFHKLIKENLQKGRINDRAYYPESIVVGHLEEDTIVGNFDGIGIDTLYVDREDCCKKFPSCNHEGPNMYYLVSKSGRLPKIRLFAKSDMPPRIVNEGDLDGNGKAEIGYMYTWDMSQWRNYRILTFHKKEWRYLIDPQEEYMSTSRVFRLSGHEIAERGKKKGTILIHYLPEGLNQSVHDRIVKPSYVKIDDVEE